jgi:hypothetical protein
MRTDPKELHSLPLPKKEFCKIGKFHQWASWTFQLAHTITKISPYLEVNFSAYHSINDSRYK